MNYEKIYLDLCIRGKDRDLTGQLGYEIHHIIPDCLGGSKDKINKVKLTYREHYLAHLLLIKTAKSKRELVKMSEALRWLCKSNHGIRTVTSRMFEVARKKRSIAQSEFQREVIGSNGETRAELVIRARAPNFAIQTIYDWYHPIHGIENLNCYQLSLKYPDINGYSSNLLKVANEERKTCRGWVLLKYKDRNFKEEGRKKMSVSAKNRTDKRKNQFTKGEQT